MKKRFLRKLCIMPAVLLTFMIVAFSASCDLFNFSGNNKSNKTPVSGDYNFAKLSQTAGSVTAVTITAKSGKSPGAVSNIRYNNSTAIPQTAGTYPVTFDVAGASGWNAADGLSAGILTVNAPVQTTCPNPAGTEILPGQAHGTYDIDHCVFVPGTVVRDMPVTNRYNFTSAVFSTATASVSTGFMMLAGAGFETYIPVIKSNVKEIRIIPAPASAKFSWVKSGNKYIVSVQVGADPAEDVALGLYNFVVDNELAPAVVPPTPEQCNCTNKEHDEYEICCSPAGPAPGCDCTFLIPPGPPPGPTPCDHNGKEHLPGDWRTLPEGDGCTCTNVPGAVSAYSLSPITNREVLPSVQFDAVVAIINEKILVLQEDGDPYLDKLQNNIEEIKVTSENGNSIYNSTTRVLTAKAGDLETLEDSFGGALANAVNAVLGRHIGHDTKDTIRLAMHGDKPMVIEA